MKRFDQAVPIQKAKDEKFVVLARWRGAFFITKGADTFILFFFYFTSKR